MCSYVERSKRSMNLQHLCRLAFRGLSVPAILSWFVIGLSSQAQTGRTYTSADYTRAANLLQASTVSLVDHAVESATFFANDRFWYLDRDPGVATLMVANASARTGSAAYDPIRMAAALHTAGLKDTDPKLIKP